MPATWAARPSPASNPALRPSAAAEQAARAAGACCVAGLDEVGRGALAGPVVAAAVVLPDDLSALADFLDGVDDSKRLSPEARRDLLPRIRAAALGVGLGSADAVAIDVLGIARATALAMRRALADLPLCPDFLLVDGAPLAGWAGAQRALVRGDRQVLSIAAASIVAKVHRDRWMLGLERRRPGYGFAAHKGYGTAAHLAALEALGPTEEHRLSWAPLRALAGPP